MFTASAIDCAARRKSGIVRMLASGTPCDVEISNPLDQTPSKPARSTSFAPSASCAPINRMTPGCANNSRKRRDCVLIWTVNVEHWAAAEQGANRYHSACRTRPSKSTFTYEFTDTSATLAGAHAPVVQATLPARAALARREYSVAAFHRLARGRPGALARSGNALAVRDGTRILRDAPDISRRRSSRRDASRRQRHRLATRRFRRSLLRSLGRMHSRIRHLVAHRRAFRGRAHGNDRSSHCRIRHDIRRTRSAAQTAFRQVGRARSESHCIRILSLVCRARLSRVVAVAIAVRNPLVPHHFRRGSRDGAWHDRRDRATHARTIFATRCCAGQPRWRSRILYRRVRNFARWRDGFSSRSSAAATWRSSCTGISCQESAAGPIRSRSPRRLCSSRGTPAIGMRGEYIRQLLGEEGGALSALLGGYLAATLLVTLVRIFSGLRRYWVWVNRPAGDAREGGVIGAA